MVGRVPMTDDEIRARYRSTLDSLEPLFLEGDEIRVIGQGTRGRILRDPQDGRLVLIVWHGQPSGPAMPSKGAVTWSDRRNLERAPIDTVGLDT